MSSSLITKIPDDDSERSEKGNAENAGPGEAAAKPKRGRKKVPDVEACLFMLAQLPGLLVMKIVTPAQANCIRGILQVILQSHKKDQNHDTQRGLSDADIMDLMRRDPEILTMLEPFLSDEQIAMAMKYTANDEKGKDDKE